MPIRFFFSSTQLRSHPQFVPSSIIPCSSTVICIIIHRTHYEKSDWSRAFSQFTIACELDMINVLSAADYTFIMSSSQAIVN